MCTALLTAEDDGASKTDRDCSYEALPDSTLGNNMLAGAFAGIAVSRNVSPLQELVLRGNRNTRSCIRWIS